MKWPVVALALFSITAFAVPALAQGQPAPAGPSTPMTPTPDDRAKQWLGLIDDSNYADAWKQAGAFLRDQIKAEKFAHDIGTYRAPLGAMSSRTIKDVKLTKTLPGMRDGQYAQVRFDSTFAHKAEAVETVTLILDNSSWSVIGYHIN